MNKSNEANTTKSITSLTVEALKQIESSQTTQTASRTRYCCLCSKPVEVKTGSDQDRALDVKCPDCIEKEQKESDKRDQLLRREKLNDSLRIVPTVFRKTDRSKLPHPEKLDAALQWKFGPMGLLLYGPTGCGKSRVAWEIAKREILDGRNVRNLTALELSRYPSMLMGDGSEAASFADGIIHSELLILDDVFKAKPTERVEELLFSVIDERGQWERPCIVTLNDTGETLSARLSSDRGPALIRRLREHCLTIQF